MDRKKFLTGILAAVSIAVGVVFVSGLYMDRKEELQKSVQIARQNEEAKPYEKEIREINAQMKEREKSLAYLNDTAEMLVGYRMYAPEDMAMIREQAETYGFSPVIVLDCTMEIKQLTNIIQSVADKGWDIMLTGSPITDEINENVTQVREVLSQSGLSDTGVFLLKSSDYSEKNVAKLAENGFKGYTCFSNTVTNGCEENGIIYFEYWYVQKGDTSIQNKLELMVDDRKAMIVVFDLENLHTGFLTEEAITERLDLMADYVKAEKMVFSVTEEIVGQLSNINEVKAQRQAEYEEYAAQQQEKINELKEKINQIYGR